MDHSQLPPEHREISRGVFRELLRQRVSGCARPPPDSEAVVARALGVFESEPFPTPAATGSLAVRMQALLVRALGLIQLEENLQNRQPLRVADLLRQLQACTLTERGIWLTLELDEALHVEADEVLLGCALGNLLNNAVRFSRNGARVGLRCFGEPGGVVIEVEDECCGFPAGPSAPRPRRHSGTVPAVNRGEGLSLTQRLAIAMDGLLEVSAHAEVGCTFALSLAAARSRPSSLPSSAR